MNTKLTLSIEQSIIEKAKNYAHKKGQSLSGLVENFLKSVTRETQDPANDITPLVESLRGSFREPDNFDERKTLAGALSEKYSHETDTD